MEAIETEFQPELQDMDSQYYKLNEVESLGDLVTKYVREHRDECLLKR